ncbi:MAG TPA: aspartate/glutamate racemase family protein [Acidimicrobiales bacterium]
MTGPTGTTVLVVNPNTTASMTARIGAAARAVARPGTTVVAVNPDEGPASIQGYHDVARAVPGLLDVVRRHPQADAVVVACFDDSGVDAARCQTDVPVLGIGEAAFHAAAMVAARFSVVTTLRRSVPGIEANLVRYGLAARCARVRASDIPVLALDRRDAAVMATLRAHVEAALADDGAEAVVLGCAGMADLAGELAVAYGVPVVDGVAAATTFAEALVATGLTTSKVGAYAAAGDGWSAR